MAILYSGALSSLCFTYIQCLNARSVTKNDGSTVKVKVRNLNTLDFGFGLGVSYDFDWGLVVSTRYNLGLTNVFDKDDVGNNKSRSFQLTAGWRF